MLTSVDPTAVLLLLVALLVVFPLICVRTPATAPEESADDEAEVPSW